MDPPGLVFVVLVLVELVDVWSPVDDWSLWTELPGELLMMMQLLLAAEEAALPVLPAPLDPLVPPQTMVCPFDPEPPCSAFLMATAIAARF